jgi:hypothetical protein
LKTGRELRMKESHRKDPASHPDPESCVGGREAAGEAFYRGHTQASHRAAKSAFRSADAVIRGGRPHRRRRDRQAARGPRAVGDPEHAWKLFARETGDPSGTHRACPEGSVGEGHRPYARHGRLGEVGRLRSTWEAAEQRRASVACGGGGEKAVDQWEHGVGGRVPDSAPDRRVDRSSSCAGYGLPHNRHHPR